MLTLFAHTLFITFSIQCDTYSKNKQDAITVDVMNSSEFAKDLDLKTVSLQEVNTPTLKIIENWNGFSVLKNEVKKMELNTPSIFELQKNDIKQLFNNLEVDIPNSLNSNNILARIKVLETNAYKFYKASSKYPKSSKQIKEIKNNTLRAYNIFIHQINKTHEKSVQLITK